jgi:probable HAF family extracellular repeat protein
LVGVLHGFANKGGTFSNVDFPGATGTQAIGVNNAGQIVGEYFDAANGEHGFVSSGGTFTAIDFPGATATVAAGINAAGDIVGAWADGTGTHGFLLQTGAFTPINFPLATWTIAFGVNDTGEIAGLYTDAAGNTHGFIYAGGGFSTVDVAGARSTPLTRIKNGDRLRASAPTP